jgi:hypothetical protein
MSEETTQKKSSSYTYWKRDIPDAHLLPSSVPQQLSHSSSEESIGNSRTTSAGLVSAWNQGTTYEERNVTARAETYLKQIAGERDIDGTAGSLVSVDGEIHAVHVRGKVRIGYEIRELKLKAGESEIEIEDLDSTDKDGFRISNTGGIDRAKVKGFVEKLMEDLCSKLLSENA